MLKAKRVSNGFLYDQQQARGSRAAVGKIDSGRSALAAHFTDCRISTTCGRLGERNVPPPSVYSKVFISLATTFVPPHDNVSVAARHPPPPPFVPGILSTTPAVTWINS